MALQTSTFRVFISSTFSDLTEERAALQELVFPELQKYCEQRGARFQAIDLRWGVSEEAARDQLTIAICLEELARCQQTTPRPNFLVLLGDRYGWRPLPFEVPAAEFDEVIRRATGADRDLLVAWYRRDDNRVPPSYVLQAREGSFEDRAVWQQVERRLHWVFQTATAEMDLSAAAALKYWASATEQEIVHGALNVADAREHVFCFFRSVTGFSSDRSTAAFVDFDWQGRRDVDANILIQHLKDRLRAHVPGNVREYRARWTGVDPTPITTDHLPQLCTDVSERLLDVIEQELAGSEHTDALDDEIARHERFGEQHRELFVGRRAQLAAIQTFIEAGNGHALVIEGASGMGKSALLSAAVEESRRRHPHAVVVARFVGATTSSFDPYALVEGLYREISRAYAEDDAATPDSWSGHLEEFRRSLTLATGERPLVLFVDGLDQVGASPADCWFPIIPPAHVSAIASTGPNWKEAVFGFDPKGTPLVWSEGLGEQAILRSSDDAAPVIVRLEGLSASEGTALLDGLLQRAGRTIQHRQRKEVLTKFRRSSNSPLYLKMAFEEARLWKSYFEPIRTQLARGATGLMRENLFARLEAPENHGQVLVSHALGYLAASRDGLSEDELLDTLSADQEVLRDFRARAPESPDVGRLPVIVWSRLRSDLEPYLTQRRALGVDLLTFFHRELRAAAEDAYLAEPRRRQRHALLADFFLRRADPGADGSWSGAMRALNELPYQVINSGQYEEFGRVLGDSAYLAARFPFAATDTALRGERHTMRDDLVRAARAWPPQDSAEPLCRILDELVTLGYRFFQTDWDQGKFVLNSAVTAAHQAALARGELVSCLTKLLDRLKPYLASPALFEGGPNAQFSGWTLYNSVTAAVADVRKRATPELSSWVVNWNSSFGDGPGS